MVANTAILSLRLVVAHRVGEPHTMVLMLTVSLFGPLPHMGLTSPNRAPTVLIHRFGQAVRWQLPLQRTERDPCRRYRLVLAFRLPRLHQRLRIHVWESWEVYRASTL